jgi:endoglucanase
MLSTCQSSCEETSADDRPRCVQARAASWIARRDPKAFPSKDLVMSNLLVRACVLPLASVLALTGCASSSETQAPGSGSQQGTDAANGGASTGGSDPGDPRSTAATGGAATGGADTRAATGGSRGAPDMTIQAPRAPADDTIESIDIQNPLQAKAMQYLDRGYNITNWLEQSRFASFTYDQAFVNQLAAAGFKSLRLPIDLDRYVDARTGTGADTELVLNDDLFRILDAFDQWTQAVGLSLTIDYHQYDESFDFDDPDVVAQAVRLWSKVAEHFAENPRQDLFYELLNEPEQASGATSALPAAKWTDVAGQMIAAIRAADTSHTIIFGDVNWYGIDKLSARDPFSDDNVIYAFHIYEPYIFTHQGASWTSMSATHDIPYPYSPERWSEYYSDLGFSASLESWILSQVKSYYINGSRSALRNRIIQAKRWAVEHNVPVICNEFGAYDARSRLEDRVRYYTDIVGIFTELAIPWQHWFMIMAKDGTVIPEYRQAFGFGF